MDITYDIDNLKHQFQVCESRLNLIDGLIAFMKSGYVEERYLNNKSKLIEILKHKVLLNDEQIGFIFEIGGKIKNINKKGLLEESNSLLNQCKKNERLICEIFDKQSEIASGIIKYEIYECDTGTEKLLKKGDIHHSYKEIIVNKRTVDNQSYWAKILMIDDYFGVGASIYREKKIEGFGLWVDYYQESKSWNWFKLKKNLIFQESKSKGEVQVEIYETDSSEEIRSISFLTDVPLRLNATNETGKVSHILKVKQGSVLTLGVD